MCYIERFPISTKFYSIIMGFIKFKNIKIFLRMKYNFALKCLYSLSSGWYIQISNSRTDFSCTFIILTSLCSVLNMINFDTKFIKYAVFIYQLIFSVVCIVTARTYPISTNISWKRIMKKNNEKEQNTSKCRRHWKALSRKKHSS